MSQNIKKKHLTKWAFASSLNPTVWRNLSAVIMEANSTFSPQADIPHKPSWLWTFWLRRPRQAASVCQDGRDVFCSKLVALGNWRKELAALKAQHFYVVLNFSPILPSSSFCLPINSGIVVFLGGRGDGRGQNRELYGHYIIPPWGCQNLTAFNRLIFQRGKLIFLYKCTSAGWVVLSVGELWPQPRGHMSFSATSTLMFFRRKALLIASIWFFLVGRPLLPASITVPTPSTVVPWHIQE